MLGKAVSAEGAVLGAKLLPSTTSSSEGLQVLVPKGFQQLLSEVSLSETDFGKKADLREKIK